MEYVAAGDVDPERHPHALHRRDARLRARAPTPTRSSSPPRPACCTRSRKENPGKTFIPANRAAVCQLHEDDHAAEAARRPARPASPQVRVDPSSPSEPACRSSAWSRSARRGCGRTWSPTMRVRLRHVSRPDSRVALVCGLPSSCPVLRLRCAPVGSSWAGSPPLPPLTAGSRRRPAPSRPPERLPRRRLAVPVSPPWPLWSPLLGPSPPPGPPSPPPSRRLLPLSARPRPHRLGRSAVARAGSPLRRRHRRGSRSCRSCPARPLAPAHSSPGGSRLSVGGALGVAVPASARLRGLLRTPRPRCRAGGRGRYPARRLPAATAPVTSAVAHTFIARALPPTPTSSATRPVTGARRDAASRSSSGIGIARGGGPQCVAGSV